MSEMGIHVKAGTAAKAAPMLPLQGDGSARRPEQSNHTFPVLLRGISEHGAAQAKEHWEVMKAGTEKLTGLVEGACSATARESADYGTQLMETARANANAAFELANA